MKKTILSILILVATTAVAKVSEFKVSNCNNVACMSWSATSKSKHFDVLKSYDNGKTFVVVGRIKYAGAGPYSYVDFFTTTGFSIYKIREVSNNTADSDYCYFYVEPTSVDICVKDSNCVEITVPKKYSKLELLNKYGKCLFTIDSPTSGVMYGISSGNLYTFRVTGTDGIVEQKIMFSRK